MNLSLVDPFVLAQDCPEVLTGSLRNGHCAYVRFSHRGDMLASGRLSGTIVIFDIETRGVACKLRGHTRQIQSLAWSSSDRYLLSASQDWKCILWDLKTGQKVRTVRFEAPVFVAELHPSNHLTFVVALFEDQPKLVDVRPRGNGNDDDNDDPVKLTLPSVPLRAPGETGDEKPTKSKAKVTTTVAGFSPRGRYIFAGTNRGWLNIISSTTGKVVHSHRISSGIAIMIRFSPSGRSLLVNSSDRIIRTFKLPCDVDTIPDPTDGPDPPPPPPPESTSADAPSDTDSPMPQQQQQQQQQHSWQNFHLELEHKFQDLISRLSWNHVGYSATGEYMLASTWMNHNIYIWERTLGTLVKILEGPKEEFSVVEWHPHRPFIAAVGVDSGNVYFWSVPTPQRWSALAPDFVEVEENVEYVEAEDEFDIRPQEELEQKRLDAEDDEDVDVLTFGDGVGPATMASLVSRPVTNRTRKRGDGRKRGARKVVEMEKGKKDVDTRDHDESGDINMDDRPDQPTRDDANAGGDDSDDSDDSDDDEDDEDDEDEDEDDGTSDAEFHMPVWLDVDPADSEDEVVAVGAGQFRRKSPTSAAPAAGGGGASSAGAGAATVNTPPNGGGVGGGATLADGERDKLGSVTAATMGLGLDDGQPSGTDDTAAGSGGAIRKRQRR